MQRLIRLRSVWRRPVRIAIGSTGSLQVVGSRSRQNHMPQKSENRCAYPWQQMIIDLTGEVVPCCYWSGYGNTGKPLGNTNVHKLEEIWNGQGFRELRKRLAADDLDDHPCGNCLAYRWAGGVFPKFTWPASFGHENGHCYFGRIPESFTKAVSQADGKPRTKTNAKCYSC